MCKQTENPNSLLCKLCGEIICIGIVAKKDLLFMLTVLFCGRYSFRVSKKALF